MITLTKHDPSTEHGFWRSIVARHPVPEWCLTARRPNTVDFAWTLEHNDLNELAKWYAR